LWESITLDNVIFVLNHKDLASFSPVKIFFVREFVQAVLYLPGGSVLGATICSTVTSSPNCWMSAPIGRLKVQNFRVDERDSSHGTCRILPTDIYEMDAAHPAYVNPLEPVHQVLNLPEFRQRAVSIHIYSKPFDSCEVYQREKGTYYDAPLHYTSEYGRLNPAETLL